MQLFTQYGKEIVAILVPFIAWVLNVWLRPKARLNYSLPHQWIFLVQEPLLSADGTVLSPNQTARTGSIFVRNSGRESAKAVEIVLNWEPKCFNIWPARHYTVHTDKDGHYSAIFDSLAPGEVLGVEMFDINRELPNLLTVRSEQATAKSINMYPQAVQSRAMQFLRISLMTIGASASIYLLIVLIQFLVLKTPLGH